MTAVSYLGFLFAFCVSGDLLCAVVRSTTHSTPISGVGDPASRWYGVDESLDLEMFGRCVLAEAMLLRSPADGVGRR